MAETHLCRLFHHRYKMKRIALITVFTPTYNNVRAASALPYHLMLGAKENGDVTFDVYSFNINRIDSESIKRTKNALGVTIHLLSQPKWMRWILCMHLTILRVCLKYPLLSYLKISNDMIRRINEGKYDLIWIYGEELSGLSTLFEETPCIVTMPDCESLYYHRLLAKRFATKSLGQIMRYAFAYWQYRSMERKFFNPHVKYHFVGQADADFYKSINPAADVLFLRHPLYEYREKENKRFHTPKLRILIAGRNNIYMKEDTDALIEELTHSERALKEKLYFTFLGKGWEEGVAKLHASGIEAQHITFAEDYIDELQKHDIQITPISVGTGTKGKVLDAIANGLLEIGTPGALENIDVKSGVSCLEYTTPVVVLTYLCDIAGNPSKYELLAQEGIKAVRQKHNRTDIAKKLFALFS